MKEIGLGLNAKDTVKERVGFGGFGLVWWNNNYLKYSTSQKCGQTLPFIWMRKRVHTFHLYCITSLIISGNVFVCVSSYCEICSLSSQFTSVENTLKVHMTKSDIVVLTNK